MIGLLFASFGVTLLTVSMPSGALSDRIGRRPPLVAGMLLLAGASLLFAFADTLPWLSAARLAQGAADAVTWVVEFALIADAYPASDRGRVTGIVMMGTSVAFMIGPSIGGWLYELGGIRLPFVFVAAMALVAFQYAPGSCGGSARRRGEASVASRAHSLRSLRFDLRERSGRRRC
jgi:DHA1 family solute carrier family 18 vesicular amine transporter 1/2